MGRSIVRDRDSIENEGTTASARRPLSRRAILVAGGALCFPRPSLGNEAPVRVGAVAGLGLDAAAVDAAASALWGRPAALVLFPSWGALRDHATLIGNAPIEGAVLPRAGLWAMPVTLAGVPATLLFSPRRAGARPATVGVALPCPGAQAAADGALGTRCVLVELPPAALADNVAAGLIDAAILIGEAARDRRPGLDAIPLGGAAALLPPLGLVRCPAAPATAAQA